jgi:hypothetical protein
MQGSDSVHFHIINIPGDLGFTENFRPNLQHEDARSVGVNVCAVQISEIYSRGAIFLEFLFCVLIVDILDARNTIHDSLNDIFIRPYHGYLREESLVLSPLAA